MMDAATAAEQAAGLRELADWIETNHDVVHAGDFSATLLMCRIDRAEFIEAARALTPTERDMNDPSWFTLIRRFGPLKAQLYIAYDKVGEAHTELRPVESWKLDQDVRDALKVAV